MTEQQFRELQWEPLPPGPPAWAVLTGLTLGLLATCWLLWAIAWVLAKGVVL